jgi:hypothetical protein
MKRVVMGIVDTPLQADRVVRNLEEVGIRPSDVSVLYPDRHGSHDFGFEAHTKAAEGALIGVTFGAMVGAMLGLAFGLAGVIVAMPIIAALAGAAVGALVMGLPAAILGMAVPKIEAKFYEGKSRFGTILVAVHIRSSRDTKLVKHVLGGAIATNIHSTSEAPLPIGH